MNVCWCPEADRRLVASGRRPVGPCAGGEGRARGETGERHKSRTNRCGTMNNVIILRHVDQLRLCKLKRVSHRKGNACVVYLILVASVVVRNDARRNQSCASTSYPMLANYTPVNVPPTTKTVPNHSTWADRRRLLLWLSSSVYGSVSHLCSLLKEAGTMYALSPSSIPSC